jgi:hypothetical protein
MNAQRSFDRFVADHVAGAAAGIRMPDDFHDDIHAYASRTRQRPEWLALIKEPPMRTDFGSSVGSPIARVAAFAAVTLLMAVLATGALVAGQSRFPATPEQATPEPPVAFTGVWCIGPPVAPDRNGTQLTLEVGEEGLRLDRYHDGAWRNAVVAMSDPRLDGDAYQTWESDTYDIPGIHGVIAATLSIVNEDGAWVAADYHGTLDDGTEVGDSAPVFVGEGAYKGLIAVQAPGEVPAPRPEGLSAAYGPCNEFRGTIFDGAPVPEPYRPE